MPFFLHAERVEAQRLCRPRRQHEAAVLDEKTVLRLGGLEAQLEHILSGKTKDVAVFQHELHSAARGKIVF